MKLLMSLMLMLVLVFCVGCTGAQPSTSEPSSETEPTETEEPTTAPTTVETAEPTAESTSIALELIAENFVSPVVLTHSYDGTGRLFVADLIGVIYVITPEGERLETPFLDLRDKLVGMQQSYEERGLLGLAFHPDYANNGRFYVYYSARLREGATRGWNHTSNISEFQVSASDPNAADLDSERIVLQIDQPQANHNGGQIAFGPDGYLYIPLGDGGGGGDVGLGHPSGQNLETLLGKILRIDVDGGEQYAIPPDNPYAEGGGLPEIFAYGFRNPYRISFDAAGDGSLYAGDVGQNLWEEVDLVTAGGNYGWNVREGTHCYDAAECPETAENGDPLIPPVIEIERLDSVSVIGGNVYRGSAIPWLQGLYVFASWSRMAGVPSGMIFTATPADPDSLWPYEPIVVSGEDEAELPFYILSMGEDEQRELYVLTTQNIGPMRNTGKVWKILPVR